MTSVSAPAMIWYHLFRKLSSRSSMATSIFLMCILVGLVFILFSMSVILQRSYSSDTSGNFFDFSISIIHGGTGRDGNGTKNMISQILSKFYDTKAADDSNFPAQGLHRQQKLLMFIAVVSSFGNAEQRNAIRATWGHPLTQLSENVMVRFFVGTPASGITTPFYNESARFDDEVILPIEDNYFKLASKSKHVLEWLAHSNAPPADFLMKVDDDSFVNLASLASYFHNVMQEQGGLLSKRMFFCRLHVNATPIRDSISNWYISTDLFNGTQYPNYCSGSAYAFTSCTVKSLATEVSKLLLEAEQIQTKDHLDHEVPEDVLVTGLAASRANASHVDMNPFFECCFYPNTSLPTSGSSIAHNGIPKPDLESDTVDANHKPTLVEWLCRRATEGAMVLHPLKKANVAQSNLMGALLVASLIGSYHDCLNLALSGSANNHGAEEDPLGSIIMIREAAVAEPEVA